MRNLNDILLINPGIYSGTRTYGQMLHEPTMGLYVLREYLSNRGFKVEILDGTYQTLDEMEILKKAQSSTVVGFYSVYTNMETIFKLSSLIKNKKSDSIIVVGGPNWPAGKEILLMEPNIDIVVKGEGEYLLERILLQLWKGKTVTPDTTDGIFLRFSGQILDTGNNLNHQTPSSNITSIQFEVPNMEKSILKLITARGCPNNCNFCPSSKWQELSSMEDLISAMESAYCNGVETFYIADENFCPPQIVDRAILMCHLIKNSNLPKDRRIHLKLFLEPQTPLRVLNYLNQVVRITAFVGFESFSNKTLKFLGKNTNRQKNLRFWNASRKIGINILPGIITLHPFLLPAELLDLIEILAMHDALSWRLLLKKLDLYPGTDLLRRINSEFPELLKDDFSSFIRPSHWNYVYDQNLGKPVLTNIERTFASLAERHEVQELYSLMFDLSFVIDKKNEEITNEYYSIRSDFVNHTKKLAMEVINKIIIQNSDGNFKKQLDLSMFQYLTYINRLLKEVRRLFSVYGACNFKRPIA